MVQSWCKRNLSAQCFLLSVVVFWGASERRCIERARWVWVNPDSVITRSPSSTLRLPTLHVPSDGGCLPAGLSNPPKTKSRDMACWHTVERKDPRIPTVSTAHNRVSGLAGVTVWPLEKETSIAVCSVAVNDLPQPLLYVVWRLMTYLSHCCM